MARVIATIADTIKGGFQEMVRKGRRSLDKSRDELKGDVEKNGVIQSTREDLSQTRADLNISVEQHNASLRPIIENESKAEKNRKRAS